MDKTPNLSQAILFDYLKSAKRELVKAHFVTSRHYDQSRVLNFRLAEMITEIQLEIDRFNN